MNFDIELVGKIGSMALIDKKSNILDYTLIARLSSELKPGYIWVTSGAAETGRLDYIQRNGKELEGSIEDVYEPFLIQRGFLVRTPKGRVATPKAWEKLGLKAADRQGELF